ncbi:MAG: SpoIIE family protein phosphatase, partial [Phycisphaerae bacterium]|nr:SpoIIE family protein phosphatase [Phycisphaerae bacterium]
SATDGTGERFGEKRFIEAVCNGFGENPSHILQDVTNELTTFFASGRHPDDISILLLHHIGPE